MKQSNPSAVTRRREAGRRSAFGVALAGCPLHELRTKLQLAGMRPTPQRMALGWLLFGKGNRHLTAEKLLEEAQASRVSISVATIYNSLHHFTEAGLLREIAIDGSRIYFDTNISEHHHFLIEDSQMLIDIPLVSLDLLQLPELPDGKKIAAIDVVVRLRSA